MISILVWNRSPLPRGKRGGPLGWVGYPSSDDFAKIKGPLACYVIMCYNIMN